MSATSDWRLAGRVPSPKPSLRCATDTGNIRFVLDGIFKDEFMDMGISAKQLEGLSFASPDL